MSFRLYFVLLICGYSYATSDEEVMVKFAKTLFGCFKDKPVDMIEILKLQKLDPTTKPEAKCLLACAYRKLGTMKSNGMFGLEEGYKFAEELQKDEKKLENAKKLTDICIKVNDEAVTDGEKGCDRAVLMYECTMKHAPELGFKVKMDPSQLMSFFS